MRNILIATSLTNDMIRPVGLYEPLPHKLHIGYYEANRLLGTEWKDGPLMSFLKDAENTLAEDLAIIQVRDWHSLDDVLQQPELMIYGPHCMAGTPGAEFIWEGKQVLGKGKNQPYVINSTTLMAATEQPFKSVLEQIVGGAPRDEVKIGVIGVLTNIKVAQIATQMKVVHGYANVAVCGALTASNSRFRHFNALDDLRNCYGIPNLESISAFSEWLMMKSKPRAIHTGFDVPDVTGKTNLTESERAVVEHLYRDCKTVDLTSLKGGFSKSRVYLARGTDRLGNEQVPMVIKIDTRESIARERSGLEKVQYILGPHVPRIEDAIESEKGAGIRCSFAMMNREDPPRMFKEFFMSLDGSKNEELERLRKALGRLYAEILRPLTSNAHIDSLQLYHANTFCQEYAKHTLENMRMVLGKAPEGDTISIAGVTFKNPALFYEQGNIEAKLKEPVAYVKQSLAHGDLNCANILIDSQLDEWVIDFFHTNYGWHAVQDIVKMENDLKFIHTPIGSEEGLRRAVRYEQFLNAQQKLGLELPALPPDLAADPNLVRLHTAVSMLRQFAHMVSGDDDMKHYRIPLLRYSAHNLSFEESSQLQKQFALASTAMHCEFLKQA